MDAARDGPPAAVRDKMLNFDPVTGGRPVDDKEQTGAPEPAVPASGQEIAAGSAPDTKAPGASNDGAPDPALSARQKYVHRMSVHSAETMVTLDVLEAEMDAMASESAEADQLMAAAEAGAELPLELRGKLAQLHGNLNKARCHLMLCPAIASHPLGPAHPV